MEMSKSMGQINLMGNMINLPIDELHITMGELLQQYKEHRKKMEMGFEVPSSVTKEEVAVGLYLNMVTPRAGSENKLSEIIDRMQRANWYPEIVENTLRSVRKFSETNGEIYYRIIKMLYFQDHATSENEMMSRCAISKSTLYRKKEEALKLFGVLLWNDFLKDHGWDAKKVKLMVGM